MICECFFVFLYTTPLRVTEKAFFMVWKGNGIYGSAIAPYGCTKTRVIALLYALSFERPSAFYTFSAACIASRKTSREDNPALPFTAKYGLLPALIITRPGNAADRREPRSRSRVRW